MIRDVVRSIKRSAPLGAARALYRGHVQRPQLSQFVSSAAPMPDGEVAALFARHGGRPCTKWLHYLPVYDRLFSPFRDGFVDEAGNTRPLRFLEIGVQRGGSLELWREYFGEDAIIHGLDIDPNCARLSTPELPVHIGSQADDEVLAGVVKAMGGVDVVLDDGSHVARHQRASFDALFPLLSFGGTYVIEDSHTSYWFRHGGGYRRPGTAIEFAKSLVDGMHRWYFRAPVPARATVAKESVASVSFFDSIIAIEKACRGRPVVRAVGGAPKAT